MSAGIDVPKFQYISCLHWICQYDIIHLVPLTTSISYTELAIAASVPEQRLKSIIRMSMTSSLFRETADGTHVLHSATSGHLARDANAYAYASYMCAKSAPTAQHMAAAHQKWGAGSMRTYETSYNLAFDTDLPFFDHISRDEARMGEFARYMRNVRSSEGVDLKHLVAGFDWNSIAAGGQVVDVGGSTGTAAIALATAFPTLNFTVQDLAVNADAGRKAALSLPAEIGSRITFQGHDFSQAQPLRGADAYLLRMILHDWPNDDAVAILKNIVAAMDKPGSRLLIMDTVLPAPGSVPVSVERIVRVRDLTMMQAFNSKERELTDWKELLAKVDQRLKLLKVVQPWGSAMSVLEVVLEEDGLPVSEAHV